METVKDPYVLKAELEYHYLKRALHEEMQQFERLRKMHEKIVSDLSSDITDKYIELQNAITEAKQYMQEIRQ